MWPILPFAPYSIIISACRLSVQKKRKKSMNDTILLWWWSLLLLRIIIPRQQKSCEFLPLGGMSKFYNIINHGIFYACALSSSFRFCRPLCWWSCNVKGDSTNFLTGILFEWFMIDLFEIIRNKSINTIRGGATHFLFALFSLSDLKLSGDDILIIVLR